MEIKTTRNLRYDELHHDSMKKGVAVDDVKKWMRKLETSNDVWRLDGDELFDKLDNELSEAKMNEGN